MADTLEIDEEVQDRLIRKTRKRFNRLFRKRPEDARSPYGDLEEIPTAEELRETVLARLRRAIEHRKPHEADWERILRAWFLQPSTIKEDGWESDRFIPLLFKHTETAHPLLVRGTLDPLGLWKVEGLTRKGKDCATAQEGLINWQGDTTGNAREAHEDKTWWMVQIGQGYVEHYWRYEKARRMVTKWVQDPADPTRPKMRRVLEEEIVVADTPYAKALNPCDVWLDPETVPGDDCHWYVELVHTTIGALREIAGRGHIDPDCLEEWVDSGMLGWGADTAGGAQGFMVDGGLVWRDFLESVGHSPARLGVDTEQELADGETPVTVLRYVSKSCSITLGDRDHVIGFSENGNTHGKTGLVVAHLYKVMGSAYGRGLGHVLLAHQELTNENINRFMDSAVLALLAPIVVDKNRMAVEDSEFVWEPNKLLRSRGGVSEVIKRADVPVPTDLALRIDAHLAADADDTTGFAAQARGMQPAASTSATAFKGVAGNLGARLTVLLERVGRSVAQSGQLFLDMNLQFLNVEKVVALRGEDALDFVTVRPEEIAERNLVKASVSAGRADPDAVAARMIQALQVSVPLFQAGLDKSPNVGRMLRAVLLALQVPNVDLIVPKQPSAPRDPIAESEFLAGGGYFEPDPRDNHLEHYKAHLARADQLEQEAAAGAPVHPAGAMNLRLHAQSHLEIGRQLGMAQAQAQAGGGGPPGAAAGTRAEPGSPQALGGPGGGDGTPGVAAPGPGAAVGRPL